MKLRQVNWDDSTAGLQDGTSDVAFAWLPIPDPDRYTWVVMAEEPRLVAMPQTHPPAGREIVDFADLLDEPFLGADDSSLSPGAPTTAARWCWITRPPADR